MMYHVSSLLVDEQVVGPDTKYNIIFKDKMVKLLEMNRGFFYQLFSDGDFRKNCEKQTGWPCYTKLFCECIFEYCRKRIDTTLYPRMRSMYVVPSLEEAQIFNLAYREGKANIFIVNIDESQCQSYDMNLFTKADTYLQTQKRLDDKVFEKCCAYASAYWNHESSSNPQVEYLYYGDTVVNLFHEHN